MVRCVRAAAKRIEENKSINTEMHETYQKRKSARDALMLVTHMEETNHESVASGRFANTHEQMLKELAEDEGQDEASAAAYLKQNKELLGFSDKDFVGGNLVDAYLEESKIAGGVMRASERIQNSKTKTLIEDGLIAIEDKIKKDGDGNIWC